MPNRVIREGLLDSQRYWSVTVEARQLFVHLMLCADDFGCVSLAPVFVRRRCFDDAPSPAKIDKLLEQLHDADLVRIYEAGGARYGFVPRFGQRLRLMRGKHPAPPEALYTDDQDAREKFSKNKAEFEKMPAGRLPTAGHLLGKRQPEVEVEVEGKRIEGEPESRKNNNPQKRSDASRRPALDKAVTAAVWTAYATAYQHRYRVEPVRNAKVNGMLARLVERLGNEDAPHVAQFYVQHDKDLYYSSRHCVDLLLRDAEGLRTEWVTGRRVTQSEARQVDRTAATGSQVERLIAENERRIAENLRGDDVGDVFEHTP